MVLQGRRLVTLILWVERAWWARRGGGWKEAHFFQSAQHAHLNDTTLEHSCYNTVQVGTENGKDAEEEEKLIKLNAEAEHKNKWIFGELSHYICASHILHSPHPHTCATHLKRNETWVLALVWFESTQ